ncbi:MAG: YtxH domain-containing protein [Nitrospirae bacterium]|nr:YtxH domain-containing protein [Nitrospirota bacterium]
MKEHCSHSPVFVLLTFLLGGLIGVAIAILMTPVPGEQTRRRLRETAEEIKEHTTHYADETKGKVAEIIEKGKEFAKETRSAFAETCACGREEKGNGAV